MKADSPERLAKLVLDAPPKYWDGRERQLELEWMTGEAPIERWKTPSWMPKALLPEADAFAELPVSTF